jgi:hypothetical protein
VDDADRLRMWTVTAHPADLPAVPFVVRERVMTGGGTDEGVVGQASTLAEARTRIRDLGGSVNLGREPGDPPVIVEVWIS